MNAKGPGEGGLAGSGRGVSRVGECVSERPNYQSPQNCADRSSSGININTMQSP